MGYCEAIGGEPLETDILTYKEALREIVSRRAVGGDRGGGLFYGDGFGQVSRLIDVVSEEIGQVIGEELEVEYA